MKISILCRYPVIHEGIKAILRNKYEDITGFTSIEDCFKTLDSTENTSLNDTEDTILIITLFKEDLKIIDNILAIKDNYSKLKLLIIDFNESKDMFFKVSKLNVDGYMLGTFAQEDISYALHTRRELEILSQLSNGLSNFEIAKNLNISENTVKKHISNIFIKINVKDRTQAIIYAYESGLIAKPLFL